MPLDPMTQLMMSNPQMFSALGMGRPPTPPAGMPWSSGMPPPPNPLAQGQVPGGMRWQPEGAPLGPNAQPGPRSNPGLAPADGAKSEPTESGQPPTQNALPSIPRNPFGALLMPRGGQIGGGMGAPPNPAGAFNWQNILGSFLQRRGGAPGVMGGGASPTGGPVAGGARPLPYFGPKNA